MEEWRGRGRPEAESIRRSFRSVTSKFYTPIMWLPLLEDDNFIYG